MEIRETIDQNKDRTNMFMILTPDNQKEVNHNLGATLDYGVTLLPFLGYDGKIGFGSDLRSNDYDKLKTKKIQTKMLEWRIPLFQFQIFDNHIDWELSLKAPKKTHPLNPPWLQTKEFS